MTTKKKLSWLIAATALTGALALGGCAGGGGGGGGDDLTIAFSADPASLDPASSANGNTSGWYVQLAYQSLLTVDENGELAPGLADKWEYLDDDFRTFQVTLRDGAKFADGTAITADDVVATIEHFRTGRGPVVQSWKHIEADAVSETEVLFTSSESNALIGTLLTPKYMAGNVISPAGLDNPDLLLSETHGAGPYTLDTANSIEGDHYTYVPNENYYDQSQIKWENVTIRVMPNSTSQAQALKTGQIDIMLGDKSVLPELQSEENISETSNAVFSNAIWLLDREGTLDPALADVRVRQALSYALDRDAITAAAYGDYGYGDSEPATPGDASYGYDEELTDYYDYDPDRARELLDDAGYSDGFDLSITYKGHQPASKVMVEAAAAQWEEIGVNVELVPATDTGDWVNMMATKEVAAAQHDNSGKPILMWIPALLDENAGINPFGAVDDNIEKASDELAAAGADEDGEASRHLVKVLMEQAVIVAISQVDEVYFYNEDVLEKPTFLGGTPVLSYVYDWEPAGGAE